MPWLVGPLPAAGRARRASTLLTQQLEKLQQNAANDAKLIGHGPGPNLVAHDADKEALANLVAFDHELYERGQKVDHFMNLQGLQNGVNWLAQNIEAEAEAETMLNLAPSSSGPAR